MKLVISNKVVRQNIAS